MARPFNHAGPRQSSAYVLSALARQVAEVEAGLKPRVEVGNLDIVRDFTDVRDVVRGYRLLAEKGAPGEIYNLGTGRGTRLADALETLASLSGRPVEVFVDPARVRPVDQPLLVADPSKLRAATGWEPRFSIEQTLADMLDDWRSAIQTAMTTERDKMLAGELYDPLDPDLVRARDRARDLCQALNATREAEQDERRRIVRELFGAGGESVWMQPPFFCDYGANIRLGERVFFNFNCVVLDVCEVRIGDFTLFGPAVQIYTATHPMNAGQRRTREFARPITIGSDVWVGGGAILCPGVTVGSRSVIGAGSVVTRDIPEGVFAAGNPCRVIREITE